MEASGYLVRYRSNRNSYYAIIITAIIHVVIILLALNLSVIKRVAHSQPSLQMVELQHEQPISESTPEFPLINFSPNAIHLTIPNIEFTEYNELSSDLSVTTTPYKLPDKNANKYKNLFALSYARN